MPSCYWCQTDRNYLTRDHVVPLGAGGPDDCRNVVHACKPCNEERGLLVGFSVQCWRLREAGAEVAPKTLRRAHRRRPGLLLLRDKWAAIEAARWGATPSADLDMTLPGESLPDPPPKPPVPTTRRSQPKPGEEAKHRERKARSAALKEARRVAEARFTRPQTHACA